MVLDYLRAISVRARSAEALLGLSSLWLCVSTAVYVKQWLVQLEAHLGGDELLVNALDASGAPPVLARAEEGDAATFVELHGHADALIYSLTEHGIAVQGVSLLVSLSLFLVPRYSILPFSLFLIHINALVSLSLFLAQLEFTHLFRLRRAAPTFSPRCTVAREAGAGSTQKSFDVAAASPAVHAWGLYLKGVVHDVHTILPPVVATHVLAHTLLQGAVSLLSVCFGAAVASAAAPVLGGLARFGGNHPFVFPPAAASAGWRRGIRQPGWHHLKRHGLRNHESLAARSC